jgi:hypothetical protein
MSVDLRTLCDLCDRSEDWSGEILIRTGELVSMKTRDGKFTWEKGGNNVRACYDDNRHMDFIHPFNISDCVNFYKEWKLRRDIENDLKGLRTIELTNNPSSSANEPSSSANEPSSSANEPSLLELRRRRILEKKEEASKYWNQERVNEVSKQFETFLNEVKTKIMLDLDESKMFFEFDFSVGRNQDSLPKYLVPRNLRASLEKIALNWCRTNRVLIYSIKVVTASNCKLYMSFSVNLSQNAPENILFVEGSGVTLCE